MNLSPCMIGQQKERGGVLQTPLYLFLSEPIGGERHTERRGEGGEEREERIGHSEGRREGGRREKKGDTYHPSN